MSQPHPKPISRTVFIVEGIKTAVVVTVIGSKLRKTEKEFASPQAALAWCRKIRAGLVYTPVENPILN